MNQEILKEFLRREPFQPLKINLVSGDFIEIRDPKLVVPMRTQVFVAFSGEDRFKLVWLRHIESVEAIQAIG